MNERLMQVGMSVSVFLIAAVAFELHALRSGVDILVNTRTDLTQYASAGWREIRGVSYTIRTYRDPREEGADFARRHEEAVRALANILDSAPNAELRHDSR